VKVGRWKSPDPTSQAETSTTFCAVAKMADGGNGFTISGLTAGDDKDSV